MTAAMAMPGNTAETFLVHLFGTGLADDRYAVERFVARADGDIVSVPAEAPAAKGRRKVRRATATLKAVRPMRPGRTEIIVCTGLRTRGGIHSKLGHDNPEASELRRIVDLANRLAAAGCPVVLKKLSDNPLRTTPLDQMLELARSLQDQNENDQGRPNVPVTRPPI